MIRFNQLFEFSFRTTRDFSYTLFHKCMIHNELRRKLKSESKSVMFFQLHFQYHFCQGKFSLVFEICLGLGLIFILEIIHSGHFKSNYCL